MSALYRPLGTRRFSRTSSDTLSFTGLMRAVHTAAPMPVTLTTFSSRMSRRGGLGPQPGDLEQGGGLVGHRAERSSHSDRMSSTSASVVTVARRR